MKQLFTIALLLSAIFSWGQSKPSQQRVIQQHYLFSTNNPEGVGHWEWSFHDNMVYRKQVTGASAFSGGIVIRTDSFPAQKPVLWKDSAGLAYYRWKTMWGAMMIIYSDSAKAVTKLIYQENPRKEVSIYNIVH